MKRPVEMQAPYGIGLHDGGKATTFDVWEMLNTVQKPARKQGLNIQLNLWKMAFYQNA